MNIREEMNVLKPMFLTKTKIRGIDLIFEIDEEIPDQFNSDKQKFK
jgi:hypothetical protein